MENRYDTRSLSHYNSGFFFFSRNIQLFHFPSNGDSSMDDLFIRSNRAVSVEPNLMNRRHLCHQKSLPNESTISQSEENRYSILKQFDNRQTNVNKTIFSMI
jgi:hypothetical protein